MKNINKILIALAMSTVMLTPGLQVSAATPSYLAGHTVKGFGPTVYYVLKSGAGRLVFPDLATYKSWYHNFKDVVSVPDWDLNAIPLVGTVTMKPGSTPIRAQGDKTVYAVARYGVKRAFTSPSAASVVYGADWNKKVQTVSPTSLATYVKGGDIAGPDQYWWKNEFVSVKSIDDNFDMSLNGTQRPQYVSSKEPAGKLTVKAMIDNGFDGRYNATSGDVKMFVGSLPVHSGIVNTLPATSYTLYFVELPGYVASEWGGDCTAYGTIAVNVGDNKTCTISFTYSPQAAKDPTLTMNVEVQNNFRGSLMPDDFALLVGSDFVKSGEKRSFAPGWYNIRSVNKNYNYSPIGWSGDAACNPDGTIELKRGHSYNCTYTWTYVKPGDFRPTMGSLVLNAIVPNGMKASDVGLFIEGKKVPAFQLNDVDPRSYTVYFSAPAGHTGTWGGDCLQGSQSNSGTVEAKVQQIKTCTVTIK